MSFASRLKQTLDERQMSQAELAARIGKGKSSVSQYLSGKNIPKDDVQKKIAEVLDCTVEFLNNEDPGTERSDDVQKNISVAECAKRIGKSEQFVRVALQQGVAPFGIAVKNKTKYDYHISPKLLDEYVSA